MREPLKKRLAVITTLLLAPGVLLGAARLVGLVDATTASSTLVGCAVSAAGGVLSGAAAERLLRRGQGGTQQLIGIGTTTLIATVTIAYIYLVQITDPLATIGTAPRAVQQILPFVQFLLGQGAGILLLSQDGTEPAAP